MVGDTGWNTVELQIEALIPGILILVEVRALANTLFSNWLILGAFMPSNEFLQVAFFIAAAYSVGLLSSLLSRLLVEFVSERGLRSFVFSCFAHVTLDKAISECSYSDTKFKNDSRHDLLIKTWKKFLIWNGVYRSALRRTTRTDEVDRRRSQGRLVRNLLVPTVIAPLILVKNPWSFILPIFLFILLLFIYAYSEYVIFAEAYDITKA